ncbi:MAG: site-2 protease family protein [Phycisphaeraceae bacterium]
MLTNAPSAIAIFILGFGFLVFVHELGHFLVARLFGVRCTQFAIGFGPSILSWRRGIGIVPTGTEKAYYAKAGERAEQDGVDLQSLPEHERSAKLHAAADALGLGETEYRLNLLPLGGYVKMVGQEDLDPDARSSDPRAYNNKPIWQRMGIISAGVVMNVIFGVVFFIVAFMIGVDFPKAVVGDVASGSPAYVTYAEGHEGEPAFQGLRIGDAITHLDVDVRIATALADPAQRIAITVARPGVDGPLTYNLTPKMRLTVPGEAKMLSAGITPSYTLRVRQMADEGGLYDAGVRPGMRIAAVGERDVESYHELIAALAAERGRPVSATFVGDEGETVSAELSATPQLSRSDAGVPNLLGFVPATRVSAVMEDAPAEKAGVQRGDLLARVGDTAWPSPIEVSGEVGEAGGDGVNVAVIRDGDRVELGTIKPGGGLIGIAMDNVQEVIVGRPMAGTPAAELDLVPGSEILAVGDAEIASWGDFQRELQERADAGAAEVALRYRLNLAEQPEATGTVELDDVSRARLLAAEWGPPAVAVAFYGLDAPLKASNPWAATLLGVEKTHEFIVQTYLTLRRLLVEQTVKVSHLRGPAGIIDEGQRIAQRGWSYLLFFLGLISVNLAVINFLPFPILDGGHMVFLGIEKIKGSPPSPLVVNIASYVALALIATFFLVVTYHDIVRIFN